MAAVKEDQGANPLFPIREVSRLTGVNTVTLRAWERRYGLIGPQRTPKGHRLYSSEDINTIHRILQWLDQGVAISQVAELLDQPPQTHPSLPCESNWEAVLYDLQKVLENQDEERLDQLYCALFTRWPAHQISNAVLWPLIKNLGETSAAAALLARYLRTRIGERLDHRRSYLAGPRLLLVPLSTQGTTDWLLLLNLHNLMDLDFYCYWLDTPLDEKALLQLLDKQKPRLLLVSNPEQKPLTSLLQACHKRQQRLAQLGESNQSELASVPRLDATRLHHLLQSKPPQAPDPTLQSQTIEAGLETP